MLGCSAGWHEKRRTAQQIYRPSHLVSISLIAVTISLSASSEYRINKEKLPLPDMQIQVGQGCQNIKEMSLCLNFDNSLIESMDSQKERCPRIPFCRLKRSLILVEGNPMAVPVLSPTCMFCPIEQFSKRRQLILQILRLPSTSSCFSPHIDFILTLSKSQFVFLRFK